MGAKLLYRDAQGRDASVDVVAEGSFLGRAADCAVRTDDAMVSRKNCKISMSGGRWYVEDLGSSNGTFVNEQRIQKQPLAHADVIRCGTLQVRFVEVAGTQQPAATPQKPRTMAMEAVNESVQVSPELTSGGGGLDPANLIAFKDQELQNTAMERDALAARLRETAQEMEAMNARLETDQSELKKTRQELVQSRDRLADITRQKSLQDEELHAQHKVGEELRAELQGLKDEHFTLKNRVEELGEEMAARDRQLERAHDDVQRAKVGTDDLRNKMAELQKTKDEGWRELNNRVGEIDHLREVINEQERILEERRVALISLEAGSKDLRAEKERILRDTVAMKSERDDLRDKVIKLNAHVEGLEEEHRRLARAMAEGGGGGSSGSALASDEHMRLANELRETRVELRKAESDRTRLTAEVARIEADRKTLDDRNAMVDVERVHLQEQKAAAEAARSRAEDSLARAETSKQRMEEERTAAQKARDSALTTSDELRREVERERKRVAELEEQLKRAAAFTVDQGKEKTAEKHADKLLGFDGPDDANDKTGEHEGLAGDHESPEARIQQLEEELAKLGTELALAQSSGNGHGNGHHDAGGDVANIKRLAEDAYTGINDALSELRTNILLAKDLVAQHGKAVPDADAVRTLTEAIQVSMDRTEDAKGLLRSLREVIES